MSLLLLAQPFEPLGSPLVPLRAGEDPSAAMSSDAKRVRELEDAARDFLDSPQSSVDHACLAHLRHLTLRAFMAAATGRAGPEVAACLLRINEALATWTVRASGPLNPMAGFLNNAAREYTVENGKNAYPPYSALDLAFAVDGTRSPDYEWVQPTSMDVWMDLTRIARAMGTVKAPLGLVLVDTLTRARRALWSTSDVVLHDTIDGDQGLEIRGLVCRAAMALNSLTVVDARNVSQRDMVDSYYDIVGHWLSPYVLSHLMESSLAGRRDSVLAPHVNDHASLNSDEHFVDPRQDLYYGERLEDQDENRDSNGRAENQEDEDDDTFMEGDTDERDHWAPFPVRLATGTTTRIFSACMAIKSLAKAFIDRWKGQGDADDLRDAEYSNAEQASRILFRMLRCASRLGDGQEDHALRLDAFAVLGLGPHARYKSLDPMLSVILLFPAAALVEAGPEVVDAIVSDDYCLVARPTDPRNYVRALTGWILAEGQSASRRLVLASSFLLALAPFAQHEHIAQARAALPNVVV
ncbi:hypothetical protein ml_480 [Mollivirus sibericum]|uniref:hypothetical protein n=1 Tax=Mollivirus sibericum TaxID=1678078 RepID=UPI0006B2E97E|nr:hypothetical protein ml_480 [Mollivirus sibericum]ALD62282.1 hypothetical protein ml_480 [Mollivirus sibericum]